MKIYLKRLKHNIDAVGDYNIETGHVIVFKGSSVSQSISHAEKFRGSKTVENYRKLYVKDNFIIKDVEFKSASTAANFVTGSSTNGLIAWKDKTGLPLRSIIKKV